jgi:16S rRNA (cytosine1402-N4)-methyltransferase
LNHISVMPTEALDNLLHNKEGDYLDCTFGTGGHSRRILENIGISGSLKAIDKDPKVQKFANQILDKRFEFKNISFSDLENSFPSESFDGMLIDLGISSFQLDDHSRGFSFKSDSILDMRMNQTQGLTAFEWLNSANEKEIADTFYYLGEERKSRALAKQIVEKRKKRKISLTSDLTNLKFPYSRSKKHPATNIFRAIRMFINNEIEELISVLKSSLSLLKKGGKLVVISFHSIEDRIVKNFLRGRLENVSLESYVKSEGKLIKPTEEEVFNNPRSRSAILRVGKKL